MRLILYIFTLLFSALCLAQKPIYRNIEFLDLQKSTLGMSDKEISVLGNLFDSYDIIDMERSDLPELEKWFAELNERLGAAFQEIGGHYPFFKVYLYASPNPTAFVYKHLPAGHRAFTGHVFLSTSLVQSMADNVSAKKIVDFSTKEVEGLMHAIQGVMAHEYSHPAQDELIKSDYEMSASRFQNHSQFDEASTDLMGMHLLRKAELEPQSMLVAIDKLDKDKGSDNLLKAAQSAASTHPSHDLRVNILRSALSWDSRENGKVRVKPIEYQVDKLKEELTLFTELHKIETRIFLENRGPVPLSQFARSLDDLLSKSRSTVNGHLRDDQLGDYLRALRVVSQYDTDALDHSDVSAWVEHLKKIEAKLGGDLIDYHIFYLELWMEGVKSPADEAAMKQVGIDFGSDTLHKRRVLITNTGLEELPQLQEYYDQAVERLLKKFKAQPFNITPIAMFLPNSHVEKFLKQHIAQLENMKLPLQVRAKSFLNAWQLIVTIDGDTLLESKIIERILQSSVFRKPQYFQLFSNFYAYSGLTKSSVLNRRLEHSRFRSGGKDYLGKSLAKFYQGLLKYQNSLSFSEEAILSLREVDFMQYAKRKRHYPVSAAELRIYPHYYKLDFDSLFNTDFKAEMTRIFSEDSVNIANRNKAFYVIMNRQIELLAVKFKGPQTNLFLNASIEFFEDVTAIAKEKMNWRRHFFSQSLQDLGSIQGEAVKLQFIKDLLEKNFIQPEDILEYFEGEELKSESDARLLFRLVDQEILTEEQLRILLKGENFFNSAEYKLIRKADFGLRVNPIPVRKVVHKLVTDTRKSGIRGIQLLEELITSFSIQAVEKDQIKELLGEDLKRLIDFQGLKTHPHYTKVIGIIRDTLIHELKFEIGAENDHSKIVGKAFIEHFDNKVLPFIQKIFNPDQLSLKIPLRETVDYSNLDRVAMDIFALVPAELSFDQRLQLWKEMTAMRTSRVTDRFFLEHLEEGVLKLKTPLWDEILTHNLTNSERVKTILAKEKYQSEIEKLKNGHKGVSNKEIDSLMSKINADLPHTSRFKDAFLEGIAWTLRLNENQLGIFIEPYKAANYKAFSHSYINLMSFLTSFSKSLKATEKIDFIRYVQEPTDTLLAVFPSLHSKMAKVVASTSGFSIEDALKYLDRLESFIRDAGESERLFLMETFVGTRDKGLYYMGEKFRDELYSMAQLEGEKLKLFKTYLKAIPAYEHTLILSYMLASVGSGEKSDILRTMEMFQTPGIKFAQMASIFSLFGEEESKQLAKAKSGAKPASKAEIFKLLRKELTPEQFQNITSIERLLGTGGVKYVVSVTYKDGGKSALYIRRPNIEASVEDILNTAQAWIDELRKDPEYAEKLDYDYYLRSLREQLDQELKFHLEAKNSVALAEIYNKVPSYQGWKFTAVQPDEKGIRSSEIYSYNLVEDSVFYHGLPEADKRVVAEYIVKTELQHLFSEGDADRHLGNYLFDPEKKLIYVIDLGQHFTLTQSSLIRPGQSYQMAQLLRYLSLDDVEKGAQGIYSVFDSIKTAPIDTHSQAKLLRAITEALKNKESSQMDKVLDILAALNRNKLRIPMSISMGFIKGLSIVTNEDYAKLLGKDYVENEIRRVVGKEILKGTPGQFLSTLRTKLNWFSKTVDAFSCEDVFLIRGDN